MKRSLPNQMKSFYVIVHYKLRLISVICSVFELHILCVSVIQKLRIQFCFGDKQMYSHLYEKLITFFAPSSAFYFK